jgi:hypothetical protein
MNAVAKRKNPYTAVIYKAWGTPIGLKDRDNEDGSSKDNEDCSSREKVQKELNAESTIRKYCLLDSQILMLMERRSQFV